MAAQAELSLVAFEHVEHGGVGRLPRLRGDERVAFAARRGRVGRVREVAVCAGHVVAPVLALPLGVVLFAAGVALQAGFGGLLRRLVGELADALVGDGVRVCAVAQRLRHQLDVGLARPVARLAARDLALPARVAQERGVRRLEEARVLHVVAAGAGVRADEIRRVWLPALRRGRRVPVDGRRAA